MPADPFYPTRRGPAALRLSFGDVAENEIELGIARVARALDRLRVTPVAV
jgi:DNA-binding transcriptional MocR family regulator